MVNDPLFCRLPARWLTSLLPVEVCNVEYWGLMTLGMNVLSLFALTLSKTAPPSEQITFKDALALLPVAVQALSGVGNAPSTSNALEIRLAALFQFTAMSKVPAGGVGVVKKALYDRFEVLTAALFAISAAATPFTVTDTLAGVALVPRRLTRSTSKVVFSAQVCA